MNSLQTAWRQSLALGPRHAGVGAARVLLVDDDVALCRMLKEFMRGGPVQLDCVHDGGEAVHRLAREHFDAVLLDVALPTLDGCAVLRHLRAQEWPPPVLMLSAWGAEEDRIQGLEAGADDYLAKPFNPRELRARLFAVLRRSLRAASCAVEPETLRLDALRLLPRKALAAIGEMTVALTSAEARILEALMRAPDRPVSRAQLTRWGLGRALLPSDRSLDTHVSNLRRKLGLDGAQACVPVLRSARGVGYVLNAAAPQQLPT